MALAAVTITACGDDSNGGGSGGCEDLSARALRICSLDVNERRAACYSDDDGPCAADDGVIQDALATLDDQVREACTNEDTAPLTVDGVVARLQTSCASETQSLASRSYGGPQGAAWAASGETDRACLSDAQANATNLIDAALTLRNACLDSSSCDVDQVLAEEQSLIEAAELDIAAACPALRDLIAVDPTTYVARAMHQVDCMTAIGHTDTGSFPLSCGPTNVDADPPRGEYVQIVLDGEKWGTVCGDGSPFAFQLWLAPEGEPLENVLIAMQGGGVCVFESDCNIIREDFPELLESLTDEAPTSGIMSNDPAESPFANWTKVYLPYCNQDVFIGGGATSAFSGFSVTRFGAINVRSAVQYVRDLLWRLLDEEGGEGYRSDRMTAMFGGFSAGAFGTIYNYHWVLDDLQWSNTAAFPDAALALNSPGALNIEALGNAIIDGPPPLGWASRPYLPPYCFQGECAVGPVLYEATAPRLLGTPQQQLLILSNQVDDTQVATTFFPDEATWINAMRSAFCDTRDLPGVLYYLTTEPGDPTESVHVVSLRPELYEGSVDGAVMSNWLFGGVSDPSSLESRVEESSLSVDIPEVDPFPCTVPP